MVKVKKIEKLTKKPEKKPRVKKIPAHYVDNQVFLAALVDYKKACRKAKKIREPKPPLPEYIGECFLKIATHLSFRPNFMNYPFREDMVGDGVVNCLTYVDNFDPKKSKNAFSYFTQIIFFAFLRKIQGEKKQMVIKYKAIQNSPFFQDLTQQVGDDAAYDNSYVQFVKKNMGDMVSDFEAKKKAKQRNKKTKNNLEKVMTE
jgi:hypothetical protein